MQLPVFGDMNFRSDGMSEDCLYLNVWSPNVSADAGLPVLVYFYGGGFVAGAKLDDMPPPEPVGAVQLGIPARGPRCGV